MKNIVILALTLITATAVNAQKPAYVIYNAEGKKVTYQKVMKNLAKQDMILFGELHDNPIAHWLQLEMTTELNGTRDLILGAEMIEADNQDALDLYLKDSIDEKGLDTMARLWRNHKTDYAPLLRLAKDDDISFIATNVPRRYAQLVYKQGFAALDSLTDQEKEWMVPLPFPFDSLLPKYQEILEMMGDHGSPNLVKAQALKDATMAYFILHNYKNGHLFIHYNGAYHSDDHEGIYWYLLQSGKDLNIATISTVSQDDISRLDKENMGKADYIICVDSDMTSTY